MAITGTTNVFPINESENAFAAEAFKPVASSHTIQILVPKVTGNITETGVASVNAQNIFDNEASCRPVPAGTINRKKSITAKVKENVIWLDKLTAGGVVPAGSSFNVEFVNGNITNPQVTTK